MRPEVSPEAAKIVSFLKVPAATFDTEDHPSTGQKTSFLSSPGHAVVLFWRLRFGKPCLFYRFRPQRLTSKITPGLRSKSSKNGLLSSPGLSFGKPWRSEVEVHLKAKSRCKIRSGASPEAAKIVFFLSVPAAAFDIEDHPSTGLRSKSCSGTNRLFFSGSGRNVWHWRSLQRRLKNGLLQLARPCCFAVLEAAFGKPCLFYRFRPQRLTLKITSAQVSEVSPAAAQIVSFLAVPAATFDTEDHPSTGRKTVSLSSPDHAVSLFRRQPFWEGFWVRSRGFAGRDIQTQPKVPTVYFEGNWRCKLRPTAAKTFFFFRFWTRRLTLKITPTQVETRCHWARQAMLFPCSGGSLFGKAFGSEVVVLPVVIPKRNRRCQRCISKAIGGANCAPKLQKPPFFLGSGRDVWQWRSPQSRSKNGRGFATMDAKRGFTWQVQKIGWFWRVEAWFYVAGARNRTLCENRGRRSSLWTLPKRWQACVIWRIAFYVTGAGNPHHGCYV